MDQAGSFRPYLGQLSPFLAIISVIDMPTTFVLTHACFFGRVMNDLFYISHLDTLSLDHRQPVHLRKVCGTEHQPTKKQHDVHDCVSRQGPRVAYHPTGVQWAPYGGAFVAVVCQEVCRLECEHLSYIQSYPVKKTWA